MTPDPYPTGALRWLKWALVVASLSLVASVGLGVGTSRDADTHVRTGEAFVAGHEGTATVSGVEYRFEVVDGMVWYDGAGMHTQGVPPCLREPSAASEIRFGYATAHGRDNSAWPVVTWVQCVG